MVDDALCTITCCDRKFRATRQQSFTLWQQVTYEVTRWDHSRSQHYSKYIQLFTRRKSIVRCHSPRSLYYCLFDWQLRDAFSTARLPMQELRVMSTLQDGQLWPGANRVKSNGDVDLPKPCRYLMNNKKYLVLMLQLEQWLPRLSYFYKARFAKTTKNSTFHLS